MTSLRQALRKLGIEGAFRLRTDLRSWPPSLRDLIRIANLPPPDLQDLQWNRIHDYTSDDAQGVAYGGDSTWFLSSKSEIRKFRIVGPDPTNPDAIAEVRSIDLKGLFAQTDLGNDVDVDHIGDVTFGHGLLFLPVKHASSPHFLLATDGEFNVVAYATLPSEASDAWCAINPWNSLLYMPHAEDDSRWLAFEAAPFADRLVDREAWGTSAAIERRSERDYHLMDANGNAAHLPGTQGIAFSTTGTLYAARYKSHNNVSWTNFIEVFSSLTGRRFKDSDAGIREIDFSGLRDEIEGVAFHPAGIMYLTVADHDLFDNDDYNLYAVSSASERPV